MCTCRRVARAEEQAELAPLAAQVGGDGSDWDEEILNAEEEGLVFFDGRHKHSGLHAQLHDQLYPH